MAARAARSSTCSRNERGPAVATDPARLRQQLGEMSAGVALRLWQAARIALVIVEPGTPKGFALIRAIRDELLVAGAPIAAPCPGPVPCPMAGADWCHFAARVERSSLRHVTSGRTSAIGMYWVTRRPTKNSSSSNNQGRMIRLSAPLCIYPRPVRPTSRLLMSTPTPAQGAAARGPCE